MTLLLGSQISPHPVGLELDVLGASDVLRSSIGGERLLDRLTGEQLPRIC